MPEPTHTLITIRFANPDMARLRELAAATDRSVGAMVRLAVRAYLQNAGTSR